MYKLSRVILFLFITGSAIYIGLWMAYGVLRIVNQLLDGYIKLP